LQEEKMKAKNLKHGSGALKKNEQSHFEKTHFVNCV
jgi:hypothetical protein